MAVSHHSEIYGVNTTHPSWFKRREKAIFWVISITSCFAFWGAVAWLVFREL